MATKVKNRLEELNGANGHDKADKAKKVRVFRPLIRELEVPIKCFDGVPLVMHKFSEKARQQIKDKQEHNATGPRRAKDAEECFQGAIHLMPGAKATDKHPEVGMPAACFRKAMIESAGQCGMKRPQVRGAVFVVADAEGLVRISYKTIRMRQDAVRLPTGVADLRYRPEFLDWSAVVRVRFDESLISAEQVVNLMARAGLSNGIGEGRPQKNGEWGQWEVMTTEVD